MWRCVCSSCGDGKPPIPEFEYTTQSMDRCNRKRVRTTRGSIFYLGLIEPYESTLPPLELTRVGLHCQPGRIAESCSLGTDNRQEKSATSRLPAQSSYDIAQDRGG